VGGAFDFDRWTEWSRDKAGALSIQSRQFVFRQSDAPLASFGIAADSPTAVGDFRCWQNQLVDFEVIEVRSGKLASSETMLQVSDDNFEQVFGSFVDAFEKVN